MAPRGEPHPVYGGSPFRATPRHGVRRVRSFMVTAPERFRRIRLVAYGARLESVLGESPRGFESPILRARSEPTQQLPAPAQHDIIRAQENTR